MSNVRTKIQTETQKKGPPKNLGKGELAYNEVDGLLYIGTGSENRGQARKKLAIAGEKNEEKSSAATTEDELKGILKIVGDAVGTLNDQELHSKTLNGGFF
jgi:hypothetical protein